MTTHKMPVLTNSPEGFQHLLGALQKARSIAREGGYFDLLGPTPELGLKGLDPMVANDRSVDLMAAYAHGERTADPMEFMNFVIMVRHSTGWSSSLAARGVELPEQLDLLEAVRNHRPAA